MFMAAKRKWSKILINNVKKIKVFVNKFINLEYAYILRKPIILKYVQSIETRKPQIFY